MRTARTLGIIALLFGIAARAQVFEAADVHPITVAIDSVMRGGYLRNGRYELRNATMADLIGAAYGVAVDKIAGGPQWIDTDRFDVIAKAPANTTPESLKAMLQALLAAAGREGVSVYAALEKQFGLKVEVRNLPAPVVVVDSVNERPTANRADVDRTLPEARTEFDVAVIKASAPGSRQRNLRIDPGGRAEFQAFTLRELIKFAFDLQDMDVLDNDDMLAGGPKWANDDRFDVIASAAPPISRDVAKLMLRALLRDRFRLATHAEERPVAVYALVAAKPKLKTADSSYRPGCRNGLSVTASATTPLFSVVCRNMTMAQLADRLQGFGGTYVPHPVIDSTRLEGAWDFTMRWTPPHLISGAPAAAGAPAPDPIAALTIVEALDKQLGLKLRSQKHSMPVLVIDHVERQPTEN